MRSSSLFDIGPVPPEPAKDRSEPVIWLRRMRIVETLRPDAPEIREIEFRRGLNIVATAVHPGDRNVVTVGHSVGKSLLTRLIRYCFGEAGYTDRAQRQRICDFVPHGYVIAEVVLRGSRWYVARPIGLDTAASASWSAHEESRLFDKSTRRPFTDFQEATSDAVMAALPQIQLPKVHREVHWIDLLAWLSPDQECGHKSHVRWRPGGTDPASRGLAIEDNHIVIRTVMDLLSPEDSGLITAHKQLQRRQGSLMRQVDLARAVAEARRVDAIEAASDNDISLDGVLQAALLQQDAKQQRESLERLLDEDLEDDPVEKWLEADAEIQRKFGETTQKLNDEQKDLETAQRELHVVERGEQELEDHANLGEWCHLFLTREEALASGCPGDAHIEPGATDPHKERRIRELKSTIANLTERIDSLQAEMIDLEGQAKASQKQLRAARRAVANRRTPLQQQIEHYRRVEAFASAFRKADEHVTNLSIQRHTLRQQIKESLEIRRESDRRYRINREQLSHHFQFVLTKLMGQEMDGEIRINANGIIPQPSPVARSRGTALGTSSLVYSFDLACLAASIAGMGHHPRFQLHDSPRDADMEEPLYHRLFELVGELERLFPQNEASFQYIITTTTQAPDDFMKKPLLRLTLDARQADGLLLKHQF